MADVALQGALNLFFATVASLVHLLENGFYIRSLGLNVFYISTAISLLNFTHSFKYFEEGATR